MISSNTNIPPTQQQQQQQHSSPVHGSSTSNNNINSYAMHNNRTNTTTSNGSNKISNSPNTPVQSSSTSNVSSASSKKTTTANSNTNVNHDEEEWYSKKSPGKAISPKTSLTTKDEKKLAHSAMERRYRQELNQQIYEIRMLIPGCNDSSLNLNKVLILKKAVEYIQQRQLAKQNAKKVVAPSQEALSRYKEQFLQQQQLIEQQQELIQSLQQELEHHQQLESAAQQGHRQLAELFSDYSLYDGPQMPLFGTADDAELLTNLDIPIKEEVDEEEYDEEGSIGNPLDMADLEWKEPDDERSKRRRSQTF